MKIPIKQNIELHNEEVREIMQEIPGSLIRWGLTIIFLVFASIIAGSYFFKFKEIVKAANLNKAVLTRKTHRDTENVCE